MDEVPAAVRVVVKVCDPPDVKDSAAETAAVAVAGDQA
jgi:hypothetical protein